MYFSNMLDQNGVREYKRASGDLVMPFNCTVGDRIAPMHVSVVNGSLVLSDSSNCKDIFNIPTEAPESGLFMEECCKLTCSQVEDTEENPMITVLAKAVHFFEGVKTFVKFVNIGEDAVLVCLVYGVCMFEFYDGDTLICQRCDSHDVYNNAKSYRYTGKDLRSMVSVIDEKSGYDMYNDMVNAVVVNIRQVKGGESSKSYRYIRRMAHMFDARGLMLGIKRAEDRMKRRELAKKKAEEEARAKAERAKEIARKKREAEVEKQYAESSLGAVDFRQMVARVKQGC